MNTYKSKWCPAITEELIYSNQVHVWSVSLDLSLIQSENLAGILSTDELARAGRFHFERDQKRFIVARGILRKILGRYLEKDPHELRFEYTTHGKPVLAKNTGYDTLRFNLSHSGEFALYAITRGRNIGIDIERVRYDLDVMQIAKSYFSQGEFSSLGTVHKNKRPEAFFQYWTRKEAFVKGMGEGISFPMEQCDVSLLSGRSLSPIRLPRDYRESDCWYGQDLFPSRGYAAAIAVEEDNLDLSCGHYFV
jgi:4'-phosphopantetheinyl transferase